VSKDQPQLINEHWTNGGTGVTNFGEEEFNLYLETVEEFGDPNIVVSQERFGWTWGVMPGGSLHHLTKKPGNLSEFWRFFDRIKEIKSP